MTEAPTHRFTARCAWEGSTAAGYDVYSRAHDASCPPAGTALRVSADPAFRGDATLLNPEQLLVLAAASCQLLSFLAVAALARVDVLTYEDDAEGEMPVTERPIRITRIVLRPRITVGGGTDVAKVAHLVEVAHRECFIANSLVTTVLVEPTITTR